VFFSHNKPANSVFSTINQRNEQAVRIGKLKYYLVDMYLSLSLYLFLFILILYINICIIFTFFWSICIFYIKVQSVYVVLHIEDGKVEVLCGGYVSISIFISISIYSNLISISISISILYFVYIFLY
jgi:hypothetical protein